MGCLSRFKSNLFGVLGVLGARDGIGVVVMPTVLVAMSVVLVAVTMA